MSLRSKVAPGFSAAFLWCFSLALYAQGPAISVSPAQLTFNASAVSSPMPQNLLLTAAGSAALKFIVTSFSGGNWLAATPASGTTPAMVAVSISVGSLTAGSYTGFISIVSAGSTTTVPVTLNVSPTGISSFTAAPASLSFDFVTASVTPQSQSISLTGTSVQSFTVSTTTGDGGGWLSVNPASGATPASLSVSVDPSSLGEGTYFGSLAITAADGTALLVPVEVNVALPGVLSVSPQQLSFQYEVGTGAPAPQTLALTTSAISAIAFTASAMSQDCGSNWLTLAPHSGSAPATVSVQINTLGLSAGICFGTINISAPSSAAATLAIPVTLTVTTGGLLQVPTSNVSFTYQVGTALPAAQTFEVTSASGAVPFHVSAVPLGAGPPFLLATPAAGSTPQAVTLALDMSVTEGLTPNSYAEMVSIGIPGAATPAVSFPVTLIVSDNPVLLLSQSSLTFNYQLGQPDPLNQTLSIASSGVPLPFTVAASAADCAGFLSASPASGTTSTTGQPAQVTLSIDTTSLTAPQTCHGTVTLSVPGSTAPVQTVPVTVNVSTTPLLDAAPCVLEISAVLGDVAPLPQMISLSSTDATTALNFTATVSTVPAGMTWLSVDPGTGATPATLNVNVNPGSLPPGTYLASINLTSTTPGVLPQSIPVVFTLAAATLSSSAPSLTFSMPAGGSNPASQTIDLTGVPAGATINVLAGATGANFLTVQTAGSTLTVSVDGSQLTQGTYQGVVTVLVPGVVNSPLYVPVTLIIGPPAVFTSLPAALTFSYSQGGSLPPPQTLLVSGATAPTVPFTALAAAPPGSTSGFVFVSVTPAGGTTPASLLVSLNPSAVSGLAPGSYTNFVNVVSSAAGDTQSILVTLTVMAPPPAAISTILSGASFQPGAISPGEVVAIFGTNIGPPLPANLTFNSAGMVETTLNDTTVTFNGVPAPLLFASLNQINALVPYQVASQTQAAVVITTSGTALQPFLVNVAPAAPAIFTLNQSGSGPGAILNQNGTLNESANPAAPGSVLVIYATGEGATTPASTTGAVTPPAGTSLPIPAGQVTITIGGLPADILYAGEAPGLIAGVLQVNAVVPSGTPSGNQPVVLTLGALSSPSTVTVAIQ